MSTYSRAASSRYPAGETVLSALPYSLEVRLYLWAVQGKEPYLYFSRNRVFSTRDNNKGEETACMEHATVYQLWCWRHLP